MEPLNIKNFEHHCTEWSNNNNVGVEYEFALYYLLLDARFRDIFKNITINNHPKKEKILQIIEAQKANIYQQISKSEYSTKFTFAEISEFEKLTLESTLSERVIVTLPMFSSGIVVVFPSTTIESKNSRSITDKSRLSPRPARIASGVSEA
jgi:hypothetical protein